MRLENLLDVGNLGDLLAEGYILQRRHPRLPLRILNYSNKCALEGKWPIEACICRGLIVDDRDVVVSRPIPKFFNLGQTGPVIYKAGLEGILVQDEAFTAEFLLVNATAWRSPLTVTRKMDGWAGITWHYGSEWGVASRGSFDSPGALYATERFQKFVKYTAVESIPEDTTLFFEIISKQTRIVVPYNFEGLVLLTAIDNETGEEMRYAHLKAFYDQLNQYAKDRPWCRLVERFDKSIEQCVADDDTTEEGYVVAVHRKGLPPIRAKIKMEEYCRLHRIITNVTPQKIWTELADPTSPWLSHNTEMDRKTGKLHHELGVPKEFAAWVRNWQAGLTQAFHRNLRMALDAQNCLEHLTGDKKSILDRMNALFDKETVKVAYKLYHGKVPEAYADLWATVRPHGKDERFYEDGKGE
jgi:RNA ligase